MIPDIEKVGRETQAVALRDLEIFDQREVPVLLVWTSVDVTAEIAKCRRAGNTG